MTNIYCALYRKYRPDKLDDIVGQNVIVKTLKNSITNNQISHAYLFTGPRGTGKTSIAKILAKTINCTGLVKNVPCNKCVSCTQINGKQNIDIIEIDAASNNGVDEIREIRNKVNLVPSISKYKVYIIDEVHMLTTGAFNALLKTLEEPPSHIVFILATTEPYKIPNTILSRCQRFDFKRICDEDIIKRLRYICINEKIEISDDALKQIAVVSDGGMRDAIGILDQAICYAEDNITLNDIYEICGTVSIEELSNFADSLLYKNLEKLLNFIDLYYNDGKNLPTIFEEIVTFLKNILLFQKIPDYFNANQQSIYSKYSDVDSKLIVNIIDMFINGLNEIKKTNSPKLLFELQIIKVINLKTSINNTIDTENLLNKVGQDNIKIEKINNISAKAKVIASNENRISKEFQELRISNTLARFSKQDTIKLKNDLDVLNKLLIDPNISQIVSMILDGELKAASDEYIIFTFETENSTNLFNKNLFKIEQLISGIIEKKYKVIGVKNSEWANIKIEYNSKIKKYNYTKEIESTAYTSNDNATKINDIDNLFGNVVEYEN